MAEPQARQNFETMSWEDSDVTYGDLFGRIISEKLCVTGSQVVATVLQHSKWVSWIHGGAGGNR